MEDKILTQHPLKKKGVNINRAKYEMIKAAILKVLDNQSEVSLKSLNDQVKKDLANTFEGSIGWYLITVKLDLEAKGFIEVLLGKKPQHLRRVK